MKKFISILMLVALTLTMFVACNEEKPETKSDLEAAADYINSLYKGADEKTASDYEVAGIVKIEGVTYTVTWTVDVAEGVTIKESSTSGFYIVDVNEKSPEEIKYVLKATIADAAGNKIEKTFNRTVPASNFMSIKDCLAAADDTFITVEGQVTLINTPWDDGYKNISVTISDKDGNKLYLYRLATNVKLGDIITVKGNMATYNGARQVAQGATAEITGHEDIVLTYPEVSLADAVKKADGDLVTVMGTVVSIEGAWSEQYNNMNCTIADKDGNKLYLYRLSTKVELGDIITVKGVVGSYNGSKQIAQGATAEITGKDSTVTEGATTTEKPAEDVKVPEGAVTYKFADYTAGEQYAKNETHKLDDVLTVVTDDAHFTSQIRLYHSVSEQYGSHHGTAVFTSTKVVNSLVIKAGNKADTLKVSVSTDGTNWTVVKEIPVTEAYADYAVVIENSTYKYFKLESTEKQIRVESIAVEYAK